jgi:O-antigen/teichoic acid export membrane protein
MHQKLVRFGLLLYGLPLVRNFGALTLSQVIARLIRFLYFIVLARLLGPEDIGIFVYGIALYLVLSGLAIFGQGIFLSTRLGQRRRAAARIVAHSFTIVLALVFLATALGLAFVWASEQATREAQAVGLLVLTLVPRSIVVWVRHCYVAIERAGWFPQYTLVFRGGEALFGSVGLLLWGDLRVICAIHFWAWLLEAVAALRKLAARQEFSLIPGRDPRLLKHIFRVSLYFMLSLWLVALFAQVGILGLGLLQEDTATVGYFGAAMQILTTFLLLPFAFGQAFLPSLSRGYRRGGPAPAVLTFVVRCLLVGGGFLAIVTQSYGAWLVALLLGDRYAPSGAVLASISWALGPYAVTLLAVQALNAIGGRNLATILAVTIVAVQSVLLGILLPFGALTAATTALLATAWLGCLLGVLFVKRQLEIDGHGWWLQPVIVLAVAGAAMSSGVVSAPWDAPTTMLLLSLLVWQLRIFRGADYRVIRKRLEASVG